MFLSWQFGNFNFNITIVIGELVNGTEAHDGSANCLLLFCPVFGLLVMCLYESFVCSMFLQEFQCVKQILIMIMRNIDIFLNTSNESSDFELPNTQVLIAKHLALSDTF